MKLKTLLSCSLILLFFYLPKIGFSQQHQAEEKGWFFDNWKDPELSWEVYRSAFIGIPPTRDMAASSLEVLFYDNVFKELAIDGNCFGMSLLSLMMIEKGGYRGFCLPIPQYSGDDNGPSSSDLRHATNIMHGHQVSLPVLRHILEIFTGGNQRDGNYAYHQFEYYHSQNDYVLVSITESLFPTDGGHTMVAYYAEVISGKKRIYVYDPSRPWTTENSWYTDGDNYIEINCSDGAWRFDKEGSSEWSGSPSSGGNIVMIPISIAGPTTRGPASLGFNLQEFLTTFFVSGENVEIEQITNFEGKQLYVPETRKIDTNPQTGILSILPFYPSGQYFKNPLANTRFGKLVYFAFGNLNNSVDIEINCGKGGFDFGVIGNTGFISVHAYGGKGKEVLTLENVTSQKPAVILRNTIGSLQYDVEFLRIIEPRKRSRIFRVDKVELRPNSAAILTISPKNDSIEIETDKEDVKFNLALTNVKDNIPIRIDMKELAVPARQHHIIRPEKWHSLNIDEIQVKKKMHRIDPRRLNFIQKRQKLKR